MSDADPVSTSRRWILPVSLSAIVGVILLATVASMLLLWPQSGQVSQSAHSSGAEGTIVTARVSSSEPVACADEGMPPAEVPANEGASDCTVVRATLPVGETVTFTLDDRQSAQRTPHEGDTVKLVEYSSESMPDAKPTYAFYDYPRGAPMVFVALAFVVIVIAVGRWRGALSLVGVAVAIALLVTFVLPAILAGKPPVLVASVGSIGIMIVVLYLAHGVSHRTTAALFGSVFGILFTAVAGLLVTRWLKFTGIGSTEDTILMVAIPGLRMSDLLTATIVIAGLGVLNDITVSQASAVWEMRALNPHLSKRRIYASAMRVGRDHIASSIYTLVFAYTGSMLVVLLLLYTYPRDLLELITSEQIAQEVIRTLIGATGLVLAMPVTTAFSVLFSKAPTPMNLEAHSPSPALLHGE